jgi:hypothetical protein
VAQLLKENVPTDDKFEEQRLTPFALAMPDKYKTIYNISYKDNTARICLTLLIHHPSLLRLIQMLLI